VGTRTHDILGGYAVFTSKTLTLSRTSFKFQVEVQLELEVEVEVVLKLTPLSRAMPKAATPKSKGKEEPKVRR
jgi:hypothetical protein